MRSTARAANALSDHSVRTHAAVSINARQAGENQPLIIVDTTRQSRSTSMSDAYASVDSSHHCHPCATPGGPSGGGGEDSTLFMLPDAASAPSHVARRTSSRKAIEPRAAVELVPGSTWRRRRQWHHPVLCFRMHRVWGHGLKPVRRLCCTRRADNPSTPTSDGVEAKHGHTFSPNIAGAQAWSWWWLDASLVFVPDE